MTIVLFIETMEDQKISELKGSIDGWKAKLDVPSDMEIYGVERRELSHSHALAHIFRESFKHGSIENLLHVIKGRSSENHDCRKVLNKIARDLFETKTTRYLADDLKEYIGHKPFEVLIGAVIGIIIPLIIQPF